MKNDCYLVIEGDTVEAITKKVNAKIKAGWKTVSGVSCSLSETDEAQYFVCTQAMRKDNETKLWAYALFVGLAFGLVLQIGLHLGDYLVPDPERQPLRIEWTDKNE